MDMLLHPAPKLTGEGLGGGIGQPVVFGVLILAGQLAVITPGAPGNVNNKCLAHGIVYPFLTVPSGACTSKEHHCSCLGHDTSAVQR
jgi:hypothetical protein